MVGLYKGKYLRLVAVFASPIEAAPCRAEECHVGAPTPSPTNVSLLHTLPMVQIIDVDNLLSDAMPSLVMWEHHFPLT